MNMNRTGKNTERRVPDGLDITDLEYLQHGDITRVAHEIGMDKSYVRRVKSLKSFNVKVLAALLKRGAKNRKLLAVR